ncbi:MAG: integrase arm-type DNA-binding domain-containing protein [Rhizobiaceae bacterium]|nr:integrase arm-type DNA-binding domain-containing protein [Rhizobiaceae bacterium]MCV0406293.1 integrase arm-type DNA-binding domain-containing protein [Rhizobiaceae bacterium]
MLTATQVKAAKRAEKPYKLTDGGGLHLFVSNAGSKLWRYRYEIRGKERLLSLGSYPDMSLLDARKARDEARDTLKAGRDPVAVKKLRKLELATSGDHTFDVIATEWYELQKPTWVDRHAHDVLVSLEQDIFPSLRGVPIGDIAEPQVLAVIRAVERRSKETARRVRQRMEAVFNYAISTGRAKANPAAVIKGAMAPMKKGKQPAITDLDEARIMLVKAEAETAHPVTKLALRILALTTVRPGTIATTPWAEWQDLDPQEPVWRIPSERMKLRLQHKGDEARDFLVPLSRQAVEAIDALRQISGRGPLAFPNTRHAHKPMSENAMGYLLNRAGYHSKHVPHGWRSTFSTVMNERFPHDTHIIDLMLAHTPKDKVEAAYNRALHLGRRRELAQEWADLILKDAKPAADLLFGPRR